MGRKEKKALDLSNYSNEHEYCLRCTRLEKKTLSWNELNWIKYNLCLVECQPENV